MRVDRKEFPLSRSTTTPLYIIWGDMRQKGDISGYKTGFESATTRECEEEIGSYVYIEVYSVVESLNGVL